MTRFKLTNMIDLLTDSLRYIVLMIVLLCLLGVALSVAV